MFGLLFRLGIIQLNTQKKTKRGKFGTEKNLLLILNQKILRELGLKGINAESMINLLSGGCASVHLPITLLGLWQYGIINLKNIENDRMGN